MAGISTTPLGSYNPYINAGTGFLRLTENSGGNAKLAVAPSLFPASGNYISAEFSHYAYAGTTSPGADGLAVVLSDAAITPVAGASGGSLGYAYGFAGGWLGVGLDEYGNYQTFLGGPGFRAQSVAARGPGQGSNGYRWIAGTGSYPGGLGIDNVGSASPAPGYMYQVVVDSRNVLSGTVNVVVNRDTSTRDGSNYVTLLGPFNAYPEASFALSQGWISKVVPDYFKLSFTGSTGGATNIHEIGSVRICSQNMLSPSGGGASGFAAIDDAYPAAPTVPSYANFQNGHIYMKLAGTAFPLWVAALTTTPAPGIFATYAAFAAKYVQVKLVDNSDGACGTVASRSCSSACTDKAAVEAGASQVAVFSSGSGSGVASPKPQFTLNSAYRSLVAVMKECTTSACTAFASTPAAACSVDAFSVRPRSFSALSSTNVNADSAGLSTTASPFVKVGAAFAMSASSGVVGYNGTPLISSSLLEWPGAPSGGRPAPGTGTLSGSFAAADAGSGSATGNSFTYDEVGYFRFKSNGVYDDSFSAVDSGNGDCTPDFSNVAVSGQYGCKFGNAAASSYFGRFIPDHFAITLPVLTAACPSATPFSYFGQDGYATAFTLTAQDSSGATTQNYHGSFAKLNLTNYPSYGFTAITLPSGAVLSSSATAPTGSWSRGVASVTARHQISRPTTPVAETSLSTRAAPGDGEVSTASPITLGSASNFRYGRLWLGNAYGSDKKSLALPYQTQYWNGKAFIANTLDNCTSLNSNNVVLANKQGSLGSYNGPVSVSATSSGAGSINLPAAGRSGSVDVLLALGASGTPSNCSGLTGGTAASLAYLSGKWCGANYDRNPVARATFGINAGARVIYMRESF
jgi:MSHA biogenesis protein MshQ